MLSIVRTVSTALPDSRLDGGPIVCRVRYVLKYCGYMIGCM